MSSRSKSRTTRSLLVESLEPRNLRTISLSVDPSGVLQILGDSTTDYVAVQMLNATQFEVRGSVATPFGWGAAFNVADIVQLSVSLGMSNDILVTQPSPTGDPFTLPMYVEGDTASLAVSGGIDQISTGAGNDTVIGHGAGDIILTGDGDDVVYGYLPVGSYSSSGTYQDADSIDAGAGNDTVFGGPDKDTISGGEGLDSIAGNESDDSIRGDNAADVLYGDDGNDFLDGGDDSDQVSGGKGRDTIYGQAGSDSLSGDADSDRIFGGTGTDSIYAGAGNDSVQGGDGGDYVLGDAGADTLKGENGDDTLLGGTENDSLVGGGGLDSVEGQDGNDKLSGDYQSDTLRGGSGADLIYGNDHDDRVLGDAGNDTVYGGSGNDQVFPGLGTDLVFGGDGDDTIVSIDNAQTDSLSGQAGFDTFWIDRSKSTLGVYTDDTTDADAEETDTNLHRVEEFENGADKTLDGDTIDDPSDGTFYGSFAGNSLFRETGPTVTDIDQGRLGDCWWLASLAAVAMTNQNAIYQAVADLGDGTYVVELDKKQYRVDADLPRSSATAAAPEFAGLGTNNTLWVPLMEKGFALRRGSYADLAGDSPYDSFGRLDARDRAIWSVIGNAKTVLEGIDSLMSSGYAATVCTKGSLTASDALVGGHCYAVIDVLFDGSEASGVTLYNPWGTDGGGYAGDSVNDGFVTISLAEFESCAANVGGAISADFSRFNG